MSGLGLGGSSSTRDLGAKGWAQVSVAKAKA